MEQVERCERCNRPLRNAKSIERGLGYVCYRKETREKAWKEFLKIQMNIYEFIEEGDKTE
jgi:hypothetical protein